MNDLFFNNIIYEAQVGEIKLKNSTHNVKFNTIIRNGTKETVIGTDDSVPTLRVKNIIEFNKVLSNYISIAREFYRGKINDEIVNNDEIDKYLLSIIWANATMDDFNSPISFLNRYIKFMNDNTLINFNKKVFTEKMDFLNGICVSIKNLSMPPHKETPYSLYMGISDYNDHEYYYPLPSIRYGISDNVCYVYTVHNDNKNIINNTNRADEEIKYNKKIGKLVYKANDQYINSLGVVNDVEEPENIKSAVPQSIISLIIFIAILKKFNIDKIVIPEYLPIRWHAKAHSNYKKSLVVSDEEQDEFLKNANNKQDYIQRNLTDKTIRNFRRLEYHFNNIKMYSIPGETTSFTVVKLDNNIDLVSNNEFLETIYNNINSVLEGNKKL